MARSIVCVGEIMLDVFVMEMSPHGQIVVRPGGTPVNAARAIGPGAVIVGRVGNDAAAAAVRSDLAAFELRFATDDQLPTGTYVELANGTVHADRGANAALSLDDVLPVSAEAVLVSGYVDIAAAVLEANVRWRAFIATPTTTSIPDAANVVFANDDEANRLDLAGAEIAVVTHGAAGATMRRRGRSTHLQPTGRSDTGAGDALAGAFIASLAG